MIGGLQDELTVLVTTAEMYEPAMQWTYVVSPTFARAHAGAAVCFERLFILEVVYGVMNMRRKRVVGVACASLRNLIEADSRWVAFEETTDGSVRVGAGVAAFNHRIYIVGGLKDDRDRRNESWVFYPGERRTEIHISKRIKRNNVALAVCPAPVSYMPLLRTYSVAKITHAAPA